MIRRPPRSTQSRSSAASDVYKRQRYSGTRVRNTSQKIRVSRTIRYLPVGLVALTTQPVSECRQRETSRRSDVKRRQAELETELDKCSDRAGNRASQLQRDLSELTRKDGDDRGIFEAQEAALQTEERQRNQQPQSN